MCIYISIGPLRRLIYYLFVDYPPMNINWAAPTIDILFVCGLPSDVYISIGLLRRLIFFI